MAGLEPQVRVYQNPEVLAHAAATLFADTSNDAIAKRGVFRTCLSGGKTPEHLYSLLAQRPYRDLISWPLLHAFWGDERCVPAEDLNNNYRQARELLLSHVPVPMENIHRVRTELDPELAAEDYALVLRRNAQPPLEWPRFDLILLGLGDDGHTASLFTGIPLDLKKPAMAVQAATANPPGWRVTLTPEVLNAGRRVVFLVQGAEKSRIVANVLYGGAETGQLPAKSIRPVDGELIWLLDQGAAANN